MADTGFSWSGWNQMTYGGGTDVNAIAIADAGSITADELSLNGKAGCEVSVEALEDNTGAVDGDIQIYVLRENEDGTYQSIDDAVLYDAIAARQNDTVYKTISIDPGKLGSCKILVYNNCGQEVAVTIGVRTATIPAAS